jgi:hypothetical protein
MSAKLFKKNQVLVITVTPNKTDKSYHADRCAARELRVRDKIITVEVKKCQRFFTGRT